MDGKARSCASDNCAFSNMDACSYVDLELLHRITDREGTSNGPRRSVEECHEPITGNRELFAPISRDLLAHDVVIGRQCVAPSLIPVACHMGGGGDNIE